MNPFDSTGLTEGQKRYGARENDLDAKTKRWVEAILSNDEASSDAELVAHFKSEGGLSDAEARAWVAKRNSYLRNALKNENLPLGMCVCGHPYEDHPSDGGPDQPCVMCDCAQYRRPEFVNAAPKCARCGQSLGSQGQLGIEHGGESYCVDCAVKKGFIDRSEVENALELRNMACPVCQDQVSGISLMIDHLEDDHDMNEKEAETVLGIRNADGIPASSAGYDQTVSTTTCTKCKHKIDQSFYEVCNCDCHKMHNAKIEPWAPPLNQMKEGARRYGAK